jgi:hypothetical protein
MEVNGHDKRRKGGGLNLCTGKIHQFPSKYSMPLRSCPVRKKKSGRSFWLLPLLESER